MTEMIVFFSVVIVGLLLLDRFEKFDTRKWEIDALAEDSRKRPYKSPRRYRDC